MKRLLVLSLFVLSFAACDDDVVDVDLIVLDAPALLNSISLDGMVHLKWSDEAYESAPADMFLEYRVYSATADIDTDPPSCGQTWDLEGTTVYGTEYLVDGLENGVPRCFTVAGITIDNQEGELAIPRLDTPRPDARNVLIWAYQVSPPQSGFIFFDDVNGDGRVGALELGAVGDGGRNDIDFWIDRDVATGDFYLMPERTGTLVAQYGTGIIDDLTSIDIAPSIGFDVTGIQALPGYGYVFEMDGGDGYLRYGALRVTHVGAEYMLFDWSYQTDPGNPELSVHGGGPVSDATGIRIKLKN